MTVAITAARRFPNPFRRLAYRAVPLRHFSDFIVVRPLFCAPAGSAGSRYVVPNGPAALYVALDADTAYRELNQDFFRTARGPLGRSLVRDGQLRPVPCVLLGILIRTSRLLDLTRTHLLGRRTRRLLGISNRSDAELLRPWAGLSDSPTQMMGNEVFNDGFFEGIIYPSAQNVRHSCLVLFRDRLLPASRIDFHDAPTGITDRLP